MGATAPGDGQGANRNGTEPSVAFHVYRLRKLQYLQARPKTGGIDQRHAGSAHRVGRRAEDAPEDFRIDQVTATDISNLKRKQDQTQTKEARK